MALEDKDRREEPTIASSLKQYNSQLHSKYVRSCPQGSIALARQRRVFVQQAEAIKEIYKYTKQLTAGPQQQVIDLQEIPTAKFQGEGMDGKIARARRLGHLL